MGGISLPYATQTDENGVIFHKPYIDGILTYSSASLRAKMLVDSGADCCSIPLGFGQALKLEKPKESEIENTNGVGGSARYVKRQIKLQFNFYDRHSFSFDAEFHWLIDMNNIPVLLGRKGFFDKFNSVNFFEKQHIIELNNPPK